TVFDRPAQQALADVPFAVVPRALPAFQCGHADLERNVNDPRERQPGHRTAQAPVQVQRLRHPTLLTLTGWDDSSLGLRDLRSHRSVALIRRCRGPYLLSCHALPRPLKRVPGVAEGALGERQDLRGRDREHLDRVRAAWVVEEPVAHLVLPAAVPLPSPGRGQARERVIVSDLDRVTLDHDIQPPVPAVAPGAEDHAPVAAQVDGLLFLPAGAEAERAAGPHGHERGHVRPAVGPDRGDPKQLSLLQRPPGLLPFGSGRGRIAESLVDGGYRGGHRITSSGRPSVAGRRRPAALASCDGPGLSISSLGRRAASRAVGVSPARRTHARVGSAWSGYPSRPAAEPRSAPGAPPSAQDTKRRNRSTRRIVAGP